MAHQRALILFTICLPSRCAFCVVPRTRGRERSRKFDSIVQEVSPPSLRIIASHRAHLLPHPADVCAEVEHAHAGTRLVYTRLQRGLASRPECELICRHQQRGSPGWPTACFTLLRRGGGCGYCVHIHELHRSLTGYSIQSMSDASMYRCKQVTRSCRVSALCTNQRKDGVARYPSHSSSMNALWRALRCELDSHLPIQKTSQTMCSRYKIPAMYHCWSGFMRACISDCLL